MHYSRNQFQQVMDSVVGKRLNGRAVQALGEVTAVQHYELGSEFKTRYNTFRYGQAGAVDLDGITGAIVIGANVTTSAGRGGGIYDPQGKPLAESISTEPKVLIAEIPQAGD